AEGQRALPRWLRRTRVLAARRGAKQGDRGGTRSARAGRVLRDGGVRRGMRALKALDIVVILVYLAGTTLLGIWVGRRQRDAKDYFVAGREIPWWAVMFSVVASETSALTFISIPGLAYTTNLGFLQIAGGYILGRIVVA